MQSALKKEFTELLRKIETINIDQSPSCNNELDKFFQNVEDDYRKIQRGLFPKVEDLRIISDILDQRHSCNNIAKYNKALLKLATDKAIGKINNYIFFEMRERLIPFNLKKGEWLFKQGRIAEALDAWEDVLKVNPDNEYVHSKLLETTNVSQAPKHRAEALHSKYLFKYIGSFGHNIARSPVAIVASESDSTLFVSDYVGNKIHKFNVQGEYLGPLSVEVKNPLGLFKDTENNIWICDLGNCRLLAVDSNGNVIAEISLKGVLGNTFALIHPRFGALKKHQFYLILMDITGQQRRVASFSRYNPRKSLKIFPLNGVQMPVDITLFGDQLYVGNYDPGVLFTYDFNRKRFMRFSRGDIPGCLYRFVIMYDDIFINAGKFILKLSSGGQDIFVANLAKILNNQNVHTVAFSVLKQGNSRILFVSDFSQTCIHKFII